MENVRTGRVSPSENNAALVLESSPPDRNTPTGTSLTFRSFTDVRSSASTRSAISSSEPDSIGTTSSHTSQ